MGLCPLPSLNTARDPRAGPRDARMPRGEAGVASTAGEAARRSQNLSSPTLFAVSGLLLVLSRVSNHAPVTLTRHLES